MKDETLKRQIMLLCFLVVVLLFLYTAGNTHTSNGNKKTSNENSGQSRYYGECKQYDDGRTVGCSGNDYCVLRTEWQEGGTHYFKGECTKR